MEDVTLTIELYKDRNTFCAYLTADDDSNDFTARGNSAKECVEKLAQRIEGYFPQEETSLTFKSKEL